MMSREQSDALAELKRELGMRKGVYPRWVSAGRMTTDEAARRLRNLERAISDLEAHYGNGRLL